MIDDNSTVREVRQFLFENREEGTVCPCCDRIAKEYHYTIGHGQAQAVITLYKLTRMLKPEDGYIHVHNEFARYFKLNCNTLSYHRLQYWELIEPMHTNDNPDKRTSGMWKITRKGIEFVEGRTTVPSEITVYGGKRTALFGDPISIKVALKQKFSYQTLMEDFYERPMQSIKPEQGALL